MLGFLLGLVARAWIASLRLTLIVDPVLAATRPRPFALAFWHGQQFALLRWARFQRMVALVSRSRDGELVAAALARLGIATARGSSSRGGAAGLKAIVRLLRGGLDAAFAVDGPRGPARVVRSEAGGVGAALSARLSGGVVVPMAAACARCHVFAKAWDRFELPLPFTRVAVALGPPMDPGDVTPEALALAIDRARGVAEGALGAAVRRSSSIDEAEALGYACAMQSRAPALHEAERPASTRPDADDAARRERFIAAVERGLADVEAGRVIDDDELGRELDEELGPLV